MYRELARKSTATRAVQAVLMAIGDTDLKQEKYFEENLESQKHCVIKFKATNPGLQVRDKG